MSEESAVLDRTKMLMDESCEDLKMKVEEMLNKARWEGDFKGIPFELGEKYDNIPVHLKQAFRERFDGLEEYEAYKYQKHDAALAALMKNTMLTHVMGLGKSRISLLAAELINKPTLIIALPRLLRKVWASEFTKLGINDWKIFERPKHSKPGFKKKYKGKPEDYRGLKGIGKISQLPVKRDADCTSDVSHPAKYKIMSYNMVLPVHVRYDFVICPKCGHKHNQEKCPNVKYQDYIPMERRHMTDDEMEFVDSRIKALNQGEISFPELYAEVKNFNDGILLYQCKSPIKGSNCPHCYTPLGTNKVSRKTGNDLHTPGFYCHPCDYSSRLWIPSISRRIKKRVGTMIIDESQAVKNWNSLRTKHTFSISSPYRMELSGTPATANLASDLYYQLKWLAGDLNLFPYKTEGSFLNEFRDDENGIKRLHSLLDPLQIRREADDYGVSVELKLPPFKERRFSIPMSEEEMANYEAASNDILEWYRQVNEDDISELDLFSKMWILRRAACTPWEDNPAIQRSTKIEALKVEVDNLVRQNRKVLIGTEMIAMLDAIEEAIPGAARIDGDVPIKKSDRIMALFQEVCPDCNIGLVEAGKDDKKVCPLCEKNYDTPMVLAVSRKAVREGVTLNKASSVIFTDPSWTYADLWQFWKRSHRCGASYEFLDIIYMESSDTIESRMYDDAERRKVGIQMGINRKKVEKAEKVDIKNFVSELLTATRFGATERLM